MQRFRVFSLVTTILMGLFSAIWLTGCGGGGALFPTPFTTFVSHTPSSSSSSTSTTTPTGTPTVVGQFVFVANRLAPPSAGATADLGALFTVPVDLGSGTLGTPTPLFSEQMPRFVSPSVMAISFDGQTLAVVDNTDDLQVGTFTIDQTDGVLTPVVTPSTDFMAVQENVSSMAFAPDSKAVYFGQKSVIEMSTVDSSTGIVSSTPVVVDTPNPTPTVTSTATPTITALAAALAPNGTASPQQVLIETTNGKDVASDVQSFLIDPVAHTLSQPAGAGNTTNVGNPQLLQGGVAMAVGAIGQTPVVVVGDATNAVTVFTLGVNGALTQLGQPFNVTNGNITAIGVATSPPAAPGKTFVYILTDAADNSIIFDDLLASGFDDAVQTVNGPSAGANTACTVDATQQFLYVTSHATDSNLTSFHIGANGVPQIVNPVTVGPDPNQLAPLTVFSAK